MTAATHRLAAWLRTPAGILALGLLILFMNGLLTAALAHGVADGDKGYIQETSGFLFWPFVYLGAKHMVTGYDHLLFLLGVIFFLFRMKDIRPSQSQRPAPGTAEENPVPDRPVPSVACVDPRIVGIVDVGDVERTHARKLDHGFLIDPGIVRHVRRQLDEAPGGQGACGIAVEGVAHRDPELTRDHRHQFVLRMDVRWDNVSGGKP
jgi:hypothetical protein